MRVSPLTIPIATSSKLKCHPPHFSLLNSLAQFVSSIAQSIRTRSAVCLHSIDVVFASILEQWPILPSTQSIIALGSEFAIVNL